MWSSDDERLLAQSLPEARSVDVTCAEFAGGHGRIEYREAGAAHLPVIFLMHGIGSSSAGYRASLAGLQDRFRLIAWNAPGYGASTPLAAAAPDTSAYVAAATALLDALGIARLAGLVGSSWGSVIAAAFAASSDVSLDALILAAPNVARGAASSNEERERARAAALQIGLASFDQDRSVIADRLLAPNAAPAVRAHALRLRDAVHPAGWEQAMSMMFTVHTPDLLQTVRARVAVIVGSEDRVAPEAQHAAVLRSSKADIAYNRLEGVGHLPKLEAPARFNAIVAGHVGRRSAP